MVLLAASSVFAENWPRFRGINGTGISASELPVTWSEGDYKWVKDLPGKGNASAVVWGDKVFVTTADEKAGNRLLYCLNPSDGSTIWEKTFPFTKFKKYRTNTYATNTPALDDKHVYVIWKSPKSIDVYAFTHEGEQVWKSELGPYVSKWGEGSSPIVHDGIVYICNDKSGNSFLVALDASNGKQVWRIDRKSDRDCFSTPCVYEVEGRPTEIIFTHSFRGITGVDAKTGTKNWEIDVFETHAQRAIGSPQIYKDLVIGSSGFTTGKRNVVIVKPTGQTGSSSVKEVYRIRGPVPHVPTPLVYKDWLFLTEDRGTISCHDAGTGDLVWQEKFRGRFKSSPVCAAGKIYVSGEEGVMHVFAAAGEFKKLGQVDLGEPLSSTPSIANGTMYIRTDTRLLAIGGK